jgi:hypothetical protein
VTEEPTNKEAKPELLTHVPLTIFDAVTLYWPGVRFEGTITDIFVPSEETELGLSYGTKVGPLKLKDVYML